MFLSTILIVLAALAMAIAVGRLASTVRALEGRVEALTAPPASPVPGCRSSRPMFSALYQERDSAAKGLGSLPGMPWLAGSLLLALAAAAGGLTARPAREAAMAAPDTAVVVLRERVDSLAGALARLQDSVRVAGQALSVRNDPKPASAQRRPAQARAAGTLPTAPRAPEILPAPAAP